MALESPALADALIAWSAGHLASREACYRPTALAARSKSLQSLVHSLSSCDAAKSEINAATSLILMTSEVCLGFHTYWYRHLTGVKDIIMSAHLPESTGDSVLTGPDALKRTAEGQWILRNFAYHDIIGSVTLGTKPLIQSQYLQGITDVVDTYLGVGSGILSFISDISCLQYLDFVHGFSAYNDQDEAFSNPLKLIEQGLQSWRCSSDTSQALASLAYAYRSSALIYLYRRMIRALGEQAGDAAYQSHELVSELHLKMQTEVFAICWHVENIVLSEIVESALLFPLFMAGCETTDNSQMNLICLRLELMLAKRHFRNIEQALEILHDIWEQRKAAQDNWSDYHEIDWREIVNTPDMVLLLT